MSKHPHSAAIAEGLDEIADERRFGPLDDTDFAAAVALSPSDELAQAHRAHVAVVKEALARRAAADELAALCNGYVDTHNAIVGDVVAARCR